MTGSTVSRGAAGAPLPRVSVVTISFNQAPFLERAIRSVIEQRDIELDYIVVDGGSTDGSRDIIERYRDRISQVVLERDDGPADALNKGLARARHPLFAYLNSDDEYLPGGLARAAHALHAAPGIDVAYAFGWWVDADGARMRHLLPPRRFTAAGYARGLSYIVQQSSIMRTEALRRAGGFNVANRTSWDGEAFFRMARGGARFCRFSEDWALFRIYGSSITGSGTNLAQFAADGERLFREQFGRPSTARDLAVRRLLRGVSHIADAPVTVRRAIGRLRRDT